ncbi:MAG: MMPL family transporter [Chloroflexi bacterium]|nr:MMPL family transporter [Chloroflexota bacterium]
MRGTVSTEAIAAISIKRPWITVGAWILAVVVSVSLIMTLLGDALTTDAELTNNPESERAWDLVRAGFQSGSELQPSTELVILSSKMLTVDDAAFEATVASVLDSISALDEESLLSVSDFYSTGDDRLVTLDRHTTAVSVEHFPDIELGTRPLWAALGRVIKGDENLSVDDAWRSGFDGGEVNGVSVNNVRAGAGDGDVIIVRSESLTVDEAEFRGFVENLTTNITLLGRSMVWQSTNYYASGEQSLVSEDRHATIIPVSANNYDHWNNVLGVIRESRTDQRFNVTVTGEATADLEFGDLSSKDLQEGELMFGLPMAIIVLILVFGALVAAALPLLIAIFAIIVALGITSVAGLAFEQSIFLVNMVFMMGLAVGIDYTLFIVARFREERSRGNAKDVAIRISSATAGRSVLFSGVTVILSLFGLLLIPHDIFISLGTGAIIVVFVSIIATLTLMPALLALIGDHVNSLRLPIISRIFAGDQNSEQGFWIAVSTIVMRYPVVAIIFSVGILVAAAIPVTTMHIGVAGVDTFPDDLEARNGYEALQRDFNAGLVESTLVVISGDITSPSVQAGITALEAAISSDPRFGEIQGTDNKDGNIKTLEFTVAGGHVKADPVLDAVRDLRNDLIPAAFAGVNAEVLVTGDSAETVDYLDTTNDAMPVVIPFVLILSFVLLTLAFRSLIVPIKAIIMNLLSVGAAYGLMVLVFEKGVLNSFFGFHKVVTIEAWVPLFLFAVLFGLSMDYHVFMLSRIREHFDRTGDNTAAVAFGLSSTGRLITGASLIMVAVFIGFASGSLVMFEQMGFGMAIAIFLDATLIRSMLVPASMKLLGKWNWWFPSWLEWLPNFTESEVISRITPEA